jgi:hypothetical protein
MAINDSTVINVYDYGARGDGIANDAPAFSQANAAANGRTILVPEGTFLLGNNVTLTNNVQFVGKVVVPDNVSFILQKNFNLSAYIEAFGDETQAFRKAFQALLNFSDHESLDLCGRRVGLAGPLDMKACDPSKDTFAIRRVIRNGQFEALDSPNWGDTVVTSQATYSTSAPLKLSNVANISSIEVGSLVTGPGVGREIYVREINIAEKSVTLSAELFGAASTQSYTFRRFKYLLDFSGFKELSQFVIADVELQCNGKASGILLPKNGLCFHLRDSFIVKPKDRGITSIGAGCQGMMIDRCQFLSNEQPLPVTSRTSIALNTNANDVKIRDNRSVKFRHFAIIGGYGTLISGNHWFNGDEVPDGARLGGIVFTTPNPKTFVTGNHCDNSSIEWTNEHDSSPTFFNQFSFGGLTITGNIFSTTDSANSFSFIVIKPYGAGHFVNGLSVVGNVFRTVDGTINRVDRVDKTYADLDYTRMRNVTFLGNVFNNIDVQTANPLSVNVSRSTRSKVWTLNSDEKLPFRGRVLNVDSVVVVGGLSAGQNNTNNSDIPYVETKIGVNESQYRLVFNSDVSGKIRMLVRMDEPI